jgi:D-alanine--poly(phosphoribitol) ligase subunit 2
MKMDIDKIINDSIKELNQTLMDKIPIEEGEGVCLYGNGGLLDSLSLVNLIVTIEGAIEEKTGISLILANDKALSQKHSPFSTMGTLKKYVLELFNNEVSVCNLK